MKNYQFSTLFLVADLGQHCIVNEVSLENGPLGATDAEQYSFSVPQIIYNKNLATLIVKDFTFLCWNWTVSPGLCLLFSISWLISLFAKFGVSCPFALVLVVPKFHSVWSTTTLTQQSDLRSRFNIFRLVTPESHSANDLTLGCRTSDSASSSKFHHLALLVSCSSNFHHWPLLSLFVVLVLH